MLGTSDAWAMSRLSHRPTVTHRIILKIVGFFFLLFARQNNSIFCLVAQMVDVMEILKYEVRLIRL